MNLSISNIAWAAESDSAVCKIMHNYGFNGLEIAPTRVFPEQPYAKLEDARKWSEELKEKYGFTVPSIQSIWYGKQEKIFGSSEEKQSLIDYTKKAIDFAETIGCKNLVFGCPRNRYVPDGASPAVAVGFFKEIGDYAAEHHTTIGMEANPPIYNTNFVNTTERALNLIREVDSAGFKLNLDLGTMVYNKEDVSILEGNAELINHVHISEPGLKPIEKRTIHSNLAVFLKTAGYQGYISIEMGKQDDLQVIENACGYVKEIFG
ncbi:sugar phosphate isomerase/epimerase [Clostridiaceae bacterium AF31-3BH]|nr:sugar phosphate isomerase/epimerase [Clostridiaceae bacterium AF31-3BH]